MRPGAVALPTITSTRISPDTSHRALRPTSARTAHVGFHRARTITSSAAQRPRCVRAGGVGSSTALPSSRFGGRSTRAPFSCGRRRCCPCRAGACAWSARICRRCLIFRYDLRLFRWSGGLAGRRRRGRRRSGGGIGWGRRGSDGGRRRRRRRLRSERADEGERRGKTKESAGRGGRVFHAWAGAKFASGGWKNETACKVVSRGQPQGLGADPVGLSRWSVGSIR